MGKRSLEDRAAALGIRLPWMEPLPKVHRKAYVHRDGEDELARKPRVARVGQGGKVGRPRKCNHPESERSPQIRKNGYQTSRCRACRRTEARDYRRRFCSHGHGPWPARDGRSRCLECYAARLTGRPPGRPRKMLSLAA